jgi:hypothetical protein
MAPTLSERMREMISALKNWQEVLSDHGYQESSQLLKIATLDLQMKLHSISDAELAAFCEAVRRKLPATPRPRPRARKLGPHFNGSERLAGRQNVVIMREVTAAGRPKTGNRE